MRGLGPITRKTLGVTLHLALMLGACRPPDRIDIPLTLGPTPSAQPSQTMAPLEPPPKMLVICLGREPASLFRYSEAYLYGDTSREADAVLEAIYDGPFDVLGYGYRPVILDKMPGLANGDVRIEPVSVGAAEVFYDPEAGQPSNLALGSSYLPAGCETVDCIQKFGGGQVEMDRMVITFRLRPGLLWSDGQPLTARDSVYSYEVDSDKDTPTLKYMVDRTASYEAPDDLTMVWTGVPGYRDQEYGAAFWSPLPEHILGGMSAAELQEAVAANQSPVGWGAYVIQEWDPGSQILLTKNQRYFRAGEGLPSLDQLLYRFIGNDPEVAYQQLLTGECDVLDETALADAQDLSAVDPEAFSLLAQGEQAGRMRLAWAAGGEVERLELNLAPVDPRSVPPIFADPRTRKAITQCVDRQALVSEVLLGRSSTPGTYLPPGHPLADASLQPLPFAPDAARQLLDEIGWLDDDGLPETPRISRGVVSVPDGTPLAFTYVATPGGFHEAIGERLKNNLQACGVQVSVEIHSQAEVLGEWPGGLVFGRHFQVAGLAWPSWVTPSCEMFVSSDIPSDGHPLGVNVSGFADVRYDRACRGLLLALPESEAYRAAAAETQRLFSDLVPSIPLFLRPRVVAHANEVCGVDVDPSALTVLWNLEALEVGGACGVE